MPGKWHPVKEIIREKRTRVLTAVGQKATQFGRFLTDIGEEGTSSKRYWFQHKSAEAKLFWFLIEYFFLYICYSLIQLFLRTEGELVNSAFLFLLCVSIWNIISLARLLIEKHKKNKQRVQ